MPITLGAHHPRLAAARELLTKKGRDAQSRFLLEGPTLLEEALHAGVEIESIFITDEAAVKYPLLGTLPPAGIALVSEQSLAKLSAVDHPTGIVAVAQQRTASREQLLAHDHLLLLAGLNDPGNVGTLMRSAHAFGIRGVLLLAGSVERHNPKVVRAAMGALFALDCAEITAKDLPKLLEGRPVIAAEAGGQSLDSFTFPARSVIAIGHERHGIPRELVKPTFTVGIPQQADSESLNAGVAGSIILYAWGKQIRLSSLG